MYISGRDVLAVGNEAGDFFLMALRTPPPPADPSDIDIYHRRPPCSTAAATAAAAQQKSNPAALGFSWDVLARKRIAVGGPAQRASASSNKSTAATTNSNTVANSGSPTRRRPEGGSSSFDDGGASNVPVAANATVGVGGAIDPVDGRRFPGAAAGRRGRRSKAIKVKRLGATTVIGEHGDGGDIGSGGGGGGGGSGISFLSPPRPSIPSPHHHRVSPGLAAAAPPGVSPSAAAAKGMVAVGFLRFSPDGGVLAAACGISIHLYREAAGAETAAAAAAAAPPGGTGESNGTGAYRRYAACKGHATKVRSFDFSRDGSVLQSNDASGELLFWEVSTGKQVRKTA